MIPQIKKILYTTILQRTRHMPFTTLLIWRENMMQRSQFSIVWNLFRLPYTQKCLQARHLRLFTEEDAHCTLRFSLGTGNTEEEIHTALRLLEEVIDTSNNAVRFVSCR